MKRTDTAGERLFYFLNNCFLALLCLVMLYPMLYVLGHSFMGDLERASHPLRLFPRLGADLSGYAFIFSSGTTVLGSYGITILRTLVGTALNLAVTALLAYPLSKRNYPGRGAMTLVICFTMWFSGGMIPTFLLIKSIGLMNNLWVYILPALVSPFNLLILRNFFLQIPDALSESAYLDGANDFTAFVRVILPLSKTSLATIGLFYAVTHWNAWMDAMLYVTDKTRWPLQYVLRQLIASANVSDITSISTLMENVPAAETVKMATIVVSTVPILCVYPFLQKYFVKGVLVGSIKG